MSKVLLTLCFMLALTACHHAEDYFTDDVLATLFSEDEIEDINTLIHFVDKKVLAYRGKATVKLAYETYWTSLKEAQEAQNLLIIITDEERFRILAKIDSSSFNAFFTLREGYRRVNYKDSIYTDIPSIKHLGLAQQSRFLEYLLQIGERETAIKEIAELLLISGDMSATMPIAMAHYYDKVDISTTHWRLLSTFYILRMEESVEDKLGRYFETQAKQQ